MPRRVRTWVVRDDDAKTVGEVVARAGGDARAIAEGRVFVGRERAREAGAPVRAGDEVTITEGSDEIVSKLTILAREADFVAIDKPAGLPTIADHAGASHALVARAADALHLAPARLHPTSRLDREVSGVVIFALTAEAADRFKRAREAHTYTRRYVAIASRPLAARAGTWDAPIGRAKDPRHRAVNGRDAAASRTHYAAVADAGAFTLVALAPITGRTHQLRLHASHAGAPLLGDRTYGGPSRVTLPSGRVIALDRIALHAARVSVPRAARGAGGASGASGTSSAALPIVIDSPVPREMRDLWLSLGGDDAAWDIAISWPLANE
jgi:23S rRNA pseudouridine1911/1915/1917 synthase